MVELQINKPTAVPEWLFVMFAVCTTVLVSVHIFALMISTYLLPNIDAVSKLHVSSLVTESPHDRMKGFIELAWAFSTILGLFLFLVEVCFHFFYLFIFFCKAFPVWSFLIIINRFHLFLFLDCNTLLGEILGLFLHRSNVSDNDRHTRPGHLRSLRHAFLPLSRSY